MFRQMCQVRRSIADCSIQGIVAIFLSAECGRNASLYVLAITHLFTRRCLSLSRLLSVTLPLDAAPWHQQCYQPQLQLIDAGLSLRCPCRHSLCVYLHLVVLATSAAIRAQVLTFETADVAQLGPFDRSAPLTCSWTFGYPLLRPARSRPSPRCKCQQQPQPLVCGKRCLKYRHRSRPKLTFSFSSRFAKPASAIVAVWRWECCGHTQCRQSFECIAAGKPHCKSTATRSIS